MPAMTNAPPHTLAGSPADAQPDADVLIVGAGPVGLSLAAALHDAGLSVQVLEQQPLAALQDPADDGREIALTHRARQVLESLGHWPALPEDVISPLQRAQVQDGDQPASLHFDAPANGPLGWLVPNHHLRRAAWQAVARRPAIRVHADAQVKALAIPEGDRPGSLAAVTLADGRCLRAALVVAADSRFSGTRRLGGIGAAMHDFGRSVVVGPVHHSHDHDGVARECFRYGNTLAMLPMTNGRSSAVVTADSNLAAQWLALSDEAFAARIAQQIGSELGSIRAAGPRHHYPLVGVYAHRFVAPRLALVGDAAVGMHPVTAHGYNFGLYGVQVLARQLAQARSAGRDIGTLATLQPYEHEHRRVTLPVYLGTNAIVTLFTTEAPAAKLARKAILNVAERLPGLSRLIKGSITRQLTGGAVAR